MDIICMITNAIPSAKVIIIPLNSLGYVFIGSKDYREILLFKFFKVQFVMVLSLVNIFQARRSVYSIIGTYWKSFIEIWVRQDG